MEKVSPSKEPQATLFITAPCGLYDDFVCRQDIKSVKSNLEQIENESPLHELEFATCKTSISALEIVRAFFTKNDKQGSRMRILFSGHGTPPTKKLIGNENSSAALNEAWIFQNGTLSLNDILYWFQLIKHSDVCLELVVDSYFSYKWRKGITAFNETNTKKIKFYSSTLSDMGSSSPMFTGQGSLALKEWSFYGND
ncbi:uncharacterized protein LOC117112679 [Anneissia japonica]|uniref:uncharacterized protein LOC117112679 n=1 Tax=Anneissia japonica TaxID=1529436 RepID=UPI00142568E2|nr:uncharacterized protein LOC117112679 [Anneissia japonica]XP_033111717.1 uncharacterized protein LOC117112679 [Anneissia japonica]XP_033111724.1 uncharacterized protein LOC117112679 [Anneissia japonica]XP_033111730.1 uncharacterized protein LOC117112679 [Anneissia japonica]